MTKTKGGPKTEQGKAVSRLNALKHGLLSKAVLLESEDAETLAELTTDMRTEFDPHGPLEEMLVDRIASCYWRLRRAVWV